MHWRNIRVFFLCTVVFYDKFAIEATIVRGHSRSSRALLFPASSTAGIFVALAIPIDLPNRNVFLSYNFEANYNLPFEGWHYIPGPLLGFEYESEPSATEDGEASEGRKINNDKNSTIVISETNRKHKKKKKFTSKVNKERKTKRNAAVSLISRAHIYKIFEEKFKHSGFKGKPCLLRTICEVNWLDFGSNNGVYGDILHIIFKPTSTENEELPEEYYLAELNGLSDRCSVYYKMCPKSVLKLISREYL
ncbi:unnamed protein product [Hermetia illucens]|uniref:Uncharacterized protein n=1 Tax=Hermetia illucens TaxID=343691 RepID=A0A7R8YVA8_HERIL|nr:unnamed protein product [Hermetia illucens]